MVSKVSYKPAISDDETKIDTETTTDEETKNAITDENNDARDDTENLDKENSKNRDYVFAYINKEQNVKKSKGVGMAEDLAVAGGGASTVGIATFGISKLVKTSGNDKNNKPSTDSAADPNPEPNNSKDPDDDSAKREKDVESFKKEKAGEFLAWSVKALLIIYIVQTIIRMIILEIQQRESDRIYFYLNSEEDENIKPFFGLWKNFTNKDRFEVDGYYSKFTTNLFRFKTCWN